MNICNIYRTVLIYLLLCYGKKFVNGDKISATSQNSPKQPNRDALNSQDEITDAKNTTLLNPLNLNSNNSNNSDLNNQNVGESTVPQNPSPVSAPLASNSPPSHVDIDLDSATESGSEEDKLLQPTKRKFAQNVQTEGYTGTEHDSELESPKTPSDQQPISDTANEPPIVPETAQEQFEILDREQNPDTETVEGMPNMLILDLNNKYGTNQIKYEYKHEEDAHIFKPIPPNNIYIVRMGHATAWQYSGRDYPLEIHLVPDDNGNPKLQIIFPQYSESETESEMDRSSQMPKPGQGLRPLVRPGTSLESAESAESQAPPPHPPKRYQPPKPAQYQPQMQQPQPAQPPQPYGGAEPKKMGPPSQEQKLISVDIKHFYSTDEIDYYYYDTEKIHKFLCKPNFLIGVVLKDGKLKKQFTDNCPNRILVLKDRNNNPIVRLLGIYDEDPDEPNYLPTPRPKQESQLPGRKMPLRRDQYTRPQMQDPRLQDPRFREQFMREQFMRDQRIKQLLQDPRMRDPRFREHLLQDPRLQDPRMKQLIQDPQMRERFMREQQIREQIMREQLMKQQQVQKKKLQELALLRLNTDEKFSTNQYSYEEKSPNVHLFTAVDPYLFNLIRNNSKVLWQAKDNKYPNKVLYTDTPGQKVRLQVAYPEEKEKQEPPPVGMMRNAMMHPGAPLPFPGQRGLRAPPKVTEEVGRPKDYTNLITVDLDFRATTEEVEYTYDHRLREDKFKAIHPFLIMQATYGPEILWTAKNENYADEIRVTYDQYGTPAVKVYFPEPFKAAPTTPAQIVPQLTDVEIRLFQDTNEVLYKYYPEYDLHKYMCKPEFLIRRIFKDGKLKKEFTDYYPNRLLIYKDENNNPFISVLRSDEQDPNEPVDPSFQPPPPVVRPPKPVYTSLQPPPVGRAPMLAPRAVRKPSIAEPELEYEVPYPEAIPVRPEVPEEIEEEIPEVIAELVPEEVEEVPEEVPEEVEELPPVEKVDYAILTGIQLYVNSTAHSDKYDIRRFKDDGATLFTVKDKNAFSSVKLLRRLTKDEYTVWSADNIREFAKRVNYIKYQQEMEEINIQLFNGSKKKFIKTRTMPWTEVELRVENIQPLNINSSRETFAYELFELPCYIRGYKTKHPFVFNKIYNNNDSSDHLIWKTDEKKLFVKKVELDGLVTFTSLSNMSLFHLNGKITHLTLVRGRWIRIPPNIVLDIRNCGCTLYYTYVEYDDYKFGVYTARNNVTFTTIKLSRMIRVTSFEFIRAAYGRYSKRVITNIHFGKQRVKFVTILFNDKNHIHFVSPTNTRQWRVISLEVELFIDKRLGKYMYKYLPNDQLPSYMTNYNFVFSRILYKKTLIWSTKNNEYGTIVIMDKIERPEYLALLLNTKKTLFFKRSERFWSPYSKFLPLHLDVDYRRTTSCIIYSYDKNYKLDVYIPRNGLFIRSLSYENRLIWKTDNEQEYALKVVMSEEKLTIYQRNRMRREFDKDLAL